MAHQILIRPINTEKSTSMREGNIYAVEVHPSATKGQIRQAIEERFKVNVIGVRTIKVLGKYRRKAGPVGGYQSNWKKALVSVKNGQQLKWEEVG